MVVPRESSEKVRDRLIDAAIGQLSSAGMRGLTHRKVEHRAGVSQGLAKYHFGNLDGLIEAVLHRLVEVELGHLLEVSATERARMWAGDVPPGVWQRAREVARAIQAEPALARARFELFLYASTRPELQRVIGAHREVFVRRVAAGLDSADPEGGARLVLALVDGILLHELSAPSAELADRVPAMLLAGGAAAAYLPGTDEGCR